jgi:hypothetical protein
LSKAYKNKPCVYCQERVSTEPDHVIAREFFLEDHRSGIPKVPSCSVCNVLKSKMENYAVTIFPFGSIHSEARAMLGDKVARRLDKNKKLKSFLGKELERVWAPSEHDLVFPTSSFPIDFEKLIPLFEMIAKGLIYYHWKAYVPSDYIIRIMTLTSEGLLFFKKNMLTLSQDFHVQQKIGNEVFYYEGTRGSADPAFTAWHFSFYRSLNIGSPDENNVMEPAHICAMTGPKNIESLVDRFLNIGAT